jgi:hypothetical protein
MTGLITFLALVFGGIAIWAAMHLKRIARKPTPRRRASPSAPSAGPADPWGVANMRRGERYTPRVTPRRT